MPNTTQDPTAGGSPLVAIQAVGMSELRWRESPNRPACGIVNAPLSAKVLPVACWDAPAPGHDKNSSREPTHGARAHIHSNDAVPATAALSTQLAAGCFAVAAAAALLLLLLLLLPPPPVVAASLCVGRLLADGCSAVGAAAELRLRC